MINCFFCKEPQISFLVFVNVITLFAAERGKCSRGEVQQVKIHTAHAETSKSLLTT